MDELTVLSHMAGSNGHVSTKLREKGLTDVAALASKDPEALADELGVERDVAQKIVTAAQAIRRVKPSRGGQARSSKSKRAITAAEEAISGIIKGKREKGQATAAGGSVTKRRRRRRYAQLVWPLLAVVLIAAMLRSRA